MEKILPRDITSYDLLKCFAVVTMIVDHTGYYFFPEELWWRAAGRLSAPVWLFLVGYARSRDFSPRLWIGAAILVVSGILGAPFFPLNILAGILLVRLILDRTAEFLFARPANLILGAGGALLLLIPTYMLVDYGVLALMLALCGWLARRAQENSISKRKLRGFMTYTLALYLLATRLFFAFTPLQFAAAALGISGIFVLLDSFRPRIFPRLAALLPAPAAALVRFGGRRTLEIYAAHLVLFRILACALGRNGYGLFEWRWF